MKTSSYLLPLTLVLSQTSFAASGSDFYDPNLGRAAMGVALATLDRTPNQDPNFRAPKPNFKLPSGIRSRDLYDGKSPYYYGLFKVQASQRGLKCAEVVYENQANKTLMLYGDFRFMADYEERKLSSREWNTYQALNAAAVKQMRGLFNRNRYAEIFETRSTICFATGISSFFSSIRYVEFAIGHDKDDTEDMKYGGKRVVRFENLSGYASYDIPQKVDATGQWSSNRVLSRMGFWIH